MDAVPQVLRVLPPGGSLLSLLSLCARLLRLMSQCARLRRLLSLLSLCARLRLTSRCCQSPRLSTRGTRGLLLALLMSLFRPRPHRWTSLSADLRCWLSFRLTRSLLALFLRQFLRRPLLLRLPLLVQVPLAARQ